MAQTKTVLLCGVGGQGTILAADLLARVALAAGRDVKVSEIHGMAQRGGAVTTVVRVGEEVHSMVSDLGCADIVMAFETTEALRNLPQLAEGGALIVNDETIKPLPVLTGRSSMPRDAKKRLQAHRPSGRKRQVRQCGAAGSAFRHPRHPGIHMGRSDRGAGSRQNR